VRYPEVHLVFADSRRFAEEWTYRFLTTALADASDPSPNGWDTSTPSTLDLPANSEDWCG
jgi:hypothetical protein